ncbi:hypothetical protein PMAYCL1PPCAC_26423, partial [Pristionchus mayeri]
MKIKDQVWRDSSCSSLLSRLAVLMMDPSSPVTNTESRSHRMTALFKSNFDDIIESLFANSSITSKDLTMLDCMIHGAINGHKPRPLSEIVRLVCDSEISLKELANFLRVNLVPDPYGLDEVEDEAER